ncbi:hypothetical protein Tco_1267931 [Tanacetum coccineum]
MGFPLCLSTSAPRIGSIHPKREPSCSETILSFHKNLLFGVKSWPLAIYSALPVIAAIELQLTMCELPERPRLTYRPEEDIEPAVDTNSCIDEAKIYILLLQYDLSRLCPYNTVLVYHADPSIHIGGRVFRGTKQQKQNNPRIDVVSFDGEPTGATVWFIVDATGRSGDGSKQTALGTWQHRTGMPKITDANDLPARVGMYTSHVKMPEYIHSKWQRRW